MTTTLTEPQRLACQTIVDAPEAWMEWAALEAKAGPDVVAELAATDPPMIESWPRSDYLGVTLSTWGAWLMDVEVVDDDHAETLSVAVGKKEVRPSEMPHWQRRWPRDVPEVRGVLRDIEHPGRLKRLYPMELIPDPTPGPEELCMMREDAETGEVIREPVKLWGMTLAIDRKVRGKR